MSASCRRLKDVLYRLQNLDPGSYALRCVNDDVDLLATVGKEENAVVDFDAEWKTDISKDLPPVKDLYSGVDGHVVLVYHTIRKQIPGAFPHLYAGKGVKSVNSNKGFKKGKKRSRSGKQKSRKSLINQDDQGQKRNMEAEAAK
ncbi:unnamed protein product [Enterobius vermicularis]|uniref:Ras-associating domain-containing protein n=1 Tax=Enterobius vermicularis TaxID=51028 RepID=A0A0N4V3P7_ENTVE|nr:unnamed protein product [Enterobius vermicularis]